MNSVRVADRLCARARSDGAMQTHRRPHLGICLLLFSVLYTGQTGGESRSSSPTNPPQVQEVSQPRVPMLDEGKGLIHLDISVTDSHGETVAGLNEQDFEVVDEGHPDKVMSFHAFGASSAQPDSPVQVVLFVDTYCKRFVDTFCMSSTTASRIQVGVEQFLRQKSGHLAQPLSIFGLSDDGLWTVAHHDSTDGNTLASDFASANKVFLNRHSDALQALAFVATAQRRKRGRKVLLWIGPGCGRGTGTFPPSSNKGQKTFDQIYWFTTLFREARLAIDEISVDQDGSCKNTYQRYLSGVRTERDADQRFLYMKVLAIQSGGNVVDDGQDLVAAMNRSVQRARNFYTLSFDPPLAVQSHEYHGLQVLVNKPGLMARTNTGYYDEPFYIDQPNPSLRRLTVEQLEQLLRETGSPKTLSESASPGFEAAGSGHSPSNVGRLSQVELTQRLSFARLSDWTAHMNRSVRQALIGVADLSAFLEPPPEDMPSRAVPDSATQQHMLHLVEDYLEKSIRKLPDFYASRTTVRYEETATLVGGNSKVDYEPIHIAEVSKAKVLYRAGNEVVESQGSEPDELRNSYLITHGTFGPLLSEVRRAMGTSGRMKWLRWESGHEQMRAVFGFEVPAAESRYFEGGCCMPDADGENSFQIQAGYHGEIAIDPEDGTVLRLQMQFDVHDYVPLDRDEILIDYAPVKIGGKTYICPARSVAIGRGRSVIPLKAGDLSFLSWGPYSTKINDMSFSNYHVFRSDIRILPGFTSEQ